MRGFRKFLTEDFKKISLRLPKVTSMDHEKPKMTKYVLKVFGHKYKDVPNRILES